MENIMYIVTLKDEASFMELTTIDKTFCATFIKAEYGNIYFELNGSKAIVIIPEEWIKTMAPSKAHWNLKHKKKKYILYHRGIQISEIDHPITGIEWYTKEKEDIDAYTY